MERIRKALADEVARHGNPEAAARALGLPVEAVRRVLDGRGLRGENYAKFRDALGIAAGEPVALVQGTDPVAQMVRTGQAEAAAWVLEFAARLLEAGAKQLRQGIDREEIISAVEQVDATQPRTSRRRASEA